MAGPSLFPERESCLLLEHLLASVFTHTQAYAPSKGEGCLPASLFFHPDFKVTAVKTGKKNKGKKGKGKKNNKTSNSKTDQSRKATRHGAGELEKAVFETKALYTIASTMHQVQAQAQAAAPAWAPREWPAKIVALLNELVMDTDSTHAFPLALIDQLERMMDEDVQVQRLLSSCHLKFSLVERKDAKNKAAAVPVSTVRIDMTQKADAGSDGDDDQSMNDASRKRASQDAGSDSSGSSSSKKQRILSSSAATGPSPSLSSSSPSSSSSSSSSSLLSAASLASASLSAPSMSSWAPPRFQYAPQAGGSNGSSTQGQGQGKGQVPAHKQKTASGVVRLNPSQASRILYSNPVCLLTSSYHAGTDYGHGSGSDTNDSNGNGNGNGDGSSDDGEGVGVGAGAVTGETEEQKTEESKQCEESSIDSIERNIMTISWLTATSNHGHFFASMCKDRHSAKLIKKAKRFVLSVPVAGMEEEVLAIGNKKNSGKTVVKEGLSDKIDHLGINLCRPGWRGDVPASQQEFANSADNKEWLYHMLHPHNRSNNKPSPHTFTPQAFKGNMIKMSEKQQITANTLKASDEKYDAAVTGCVAHLVCELDRADEDAIPHHLALFGRITLAWVSAEYWETQHNRFRPLAKGTPPSLSFYGSQEFGYVMPEKHLQKRR